MADDDAPNRDTMNGNTMVPSYPRTVSFWRLMTDQQVITWEILNYEYAGSGTEEEPYVVSWLPHDPRDPMQFSMARKVTTVLATAFATFVVSLASSAYSGSIQSIISHFNVSEEVATSGLSLFVFGFSVGPILWAPLSESIGRQNTLFLFVFIHGGLLCGMRRGTKYPYAFDSALFCRCLWFFAVDKCRWCCF